MSRTVFSALWLGLAALGSTTPLGLDIFRPTPADNPLTQAKISLGRRLFEDRRLSRDGTVACSSCHDPTRAFTDGRAVGVGVGTAQGRRNVPTIINRVYGATFFWDGRAASLEQQAKQPLLDSREMASTPDAIVRVVSADRGYRRQFRSVFGHEAQFDDVARALAAYVRTVLSGNSPYDRFKHGDRSALDEHEQEGVRLFLGRANCWSCHSGPNLSDERFHNTGVAFRDGVWLDEGRFVITANPTDRGSFKTPTLREVAMTAPYMHDGSMRTLESVIDFYDRGGNANPNLDSVLRTIGLTADDKHALVAFLRSLSGKVQDGP